MLSEGGCPKSMHSIKDALDALEGSWKLLILFALSEGSKRFNELSREVSGISDKMLSKELKSLEMNKLVTRTEQDTFPLSVEYSITKHGESLEDVLKSLHYWGLLHRQEVIGKRNPEITSEQA